MSSEPETEQGNDNGDTPPEDAEAASSLSSQEAKTPDALKGAPPQVKKQVWEMMAATFSAGNPSHPLLEKLEASHIDKFLDYAHEDDQREHEHRKAERWIRLIYFFALFLALFVLIWLLLPSHQALLEDLLKIMAVFAGGFGAGYGYKAARIRGGQ